MGEQQQFWEQLKLQYEKKNLVLQQREQELRLKLEAMDSIIGDSTRQTTSNPDCTCEKPGFLKGLLSIFGSSKPKAPSGAYCYCSSNPGTPSPPPRAPQDVPTKENKVDPSKNLNCRCDPCEAEDLYQSKTNDDNLCNCSVCSKITLGSPTNPKRKVCACDLAAETEDICSCSLTEVEIPRSPAKASYGVASPSKFSLKSLDLHYMKNIHDLASQQKDLLKHVNDLEQKAKIYENVFTEYKNVDFSPRERECKCNIEAKPADSNEKTTAELKLENFLLKNELKDMRLEVRQYLERMEGPMQFKIESERYKCIQLEQKLEEADKELRNLKDFYQKEINSIKMDLCTSNTNTYNLSSVNAQLTQELEECQKKCAKLEENLIRQKISEADTIRSLQAALNARDDNATKDECQLHGIARELSKILKNCEPCGDCMNLPDDLTAAARLLKSLTDMVDIKLNLDPFETKPSANVSKVDTLEIVAKQEITAGECETSIQLKKPPSRTPSMNVGPPTITSITIDQDSEHADQQEAIEFDCEKRSDRFNRYNTPVLIPALSLPPPRSKLSCSCVKKSSKEVDQLWPKNDKPIALKDSDFIEPQILTKNKSCECSISRNLKEQAPQVEPAKKRSSVTGKKPCPCDIKPSEAFDVDTTRAPETSPDLTTERFKLSHQVTASKSKEILKSETNIKCLQVKENFPFDVDTKVDVLNRPPDGVHVTTTITDSGTLEVITEGPEGVVETTLIYTKSGNVEVVTEVLQYADKACKKRVGGPKLPALEGPDVLRASASEPAKITEIVQPPVDVTRSGPVVNANCLCPECPDPLKGTGPLNGSPPKDSAPQITELPELPEQQQESQGPQEQEQVQEVEDVSPSDPVPEEVTPEIAEPEVVKALSFSVHVEDQSEPAPSDENKEAEQ